MKWILQHLLNFISAIAFSFIGYFAPIKGVVHLMIIVIVIDLVIGIVVAIRNGHGISSRKLWRTAYKLLFAILIVSLTYSMDKEMGVVSIHKFVAWLITGFEIWSILENAAKITNHRIFILLKQVMEDKVKKTTGINLKEDE